MGLFFALRGLLLDVHLHSWLAVLLGATIATTAGIAKGQTILRRIALQNLSRLSRLHHPTPIHRVFPGSTWLLVAFFMGLGLAIRLSPLPLIVRSTVLLAVGLALLIGSLHIFQNLAPAFPDSGPQASKP